MVIGKSIYKFSLLKYNDSLMNFMKLSKVTDGNYQRVYVQQESYGNIKLIKFKEYVKEEKNKNIEYKYVAIIDYENNLDTAIQILIGDVYEQNSNPYKYRDITTYACNLIRFTNMNALLNDIQ